MRPVKFGKNRFCGPAAISIIIGCDTDVAAAAIRHTTTLKAVKGTHASEILAALQLFGVTVLQRGSVEKVNDLREREGTFLVGTVDHWLVVEGGRVCDNLLERPVAITNPKAPQYARVERYYRLSKKTQNWSPTPKKRDSNKSWCRRQDGFELDVIHDECIGVFPPDGVPDAYEEEHYVYSWGEAADRIREYQTNSFQKVMS